MKKLLGLFLCLSLININLGMEYGSAEVDDDYLLSKTADEQLEIAIDYFSKIAEDEKNYDTAMAWLISAAVGGNAQAQVIVSLQAHELGDYSMALDFAQLAVDQNDAHGRNVLAWIYYNGYGVPQDYQQAFKYYSLSAVQGWTDSEFMLGYMYEQGLYVEQSYTSAARNYRLAAEKNYAKAQLRLGIMYFEGNGVRKDYNLSKELVGKSCDNGYDEGCNLYKRFP